MAQEKILFIITKDIDLVSHRLQLVQLAAMRHYKVSVLTKDTGLRGKIEAHDIQFIEWHIKRNRLNLFYQFKDWLTLYKTIRKIQPDLIHAVALKPVLYTLVANVVQRKKVICALGGMGHTATIHTFKNKMIQYLISILFALFYNKNKCRFIIQNAHDKNYIIRKYKIPPATIKQLNGAGVDSHAFAYIDRAKKSELIIGMASRLLWPKGVGHFVEAVQMLKQKGAVNGIKCRFVLIGAPNDNPYTVPPTQLQAWHDAGIIEHWGYKTDMPAILAQLDILCLPTFYGEGVPKILIEGAATGLPLIAYNVAGCDVIIDDMQNGILVPPKNIQALAQAIEKLIKDRALRLSMGKKGRAKVEQDFTVEKINEETLSLWQELLA